MLRIIFSFNDEDALMRVPEKDRKWQWILASMHRRGQILQYFVPLMAAINTPGVRRAYYDHLMNTDYSNFNFMTQRAHCDLYESSKLNSVKREVRFMLHYVMTHAKEIRERYKIQDEKRKGVITVMTGDLFEMFTGWWSIIASAGRQAEAGFNITAFSIAISKIPGFTKNSRHGAGSSYHIDTVRLLDRLIELTLLVSLQKEWILDTNEDVKAELFSYGAYTAEVEKRVIEQMSFATS
jgi:hypothetical protein